MFSVCLRVKKITLVTPNYPSPREIERGAFVERLVNDWEKSGRLVNVIAPLPYFNRARFQLIFGKKLQKKIAGNKVLYPRFLSLTSKKFFNYDLSRIANINFQTTVLRAQKRLEVPDIFYGKFLMQGGVAVAKLAKTYGVKAFLDLGESSLVSKMSSEEVAFARDLMKSFDGVVCVSPRLREEAIALGVPKSKVLLAPNEADAARFYPMDKMDCRRKLNLSERDFIVIFVGHFVERKGPLRVLEAIMRVGENVKGVFLGRGIQKPIGEAVLYASPVPNDELVYWLNAADVMMLPTLAEGSCNAINEALACGLPVITSDIDDVRWQTDKSCTLVNPLNIDALTEALRKSMTLPSKRVIDQRPIKKSDRSATIIAWMESVLSNPV